MTVQENKELAMSWLEAGFNGDSDRWLSLLHEDFHYWNGGKWHDRAGYVGIADRLSNDLLKGEFSLKIGTITAEEDRVVVEAEPSYDLQSGNHYHNFYVYILRFRDGKIVSFTNHFDTAHADRIFDNRETKVAETERESPLLQVTQTFKGSGPLPAPTA